MDTVCMIWQEMLMNGAGIGVLMVRGQMIRARLRLIREVPLNLICFGCFEAGPGRILRYVAVWRVGIMTSRQPL